ncbi:hypothetical protein [Micromonospora sp. NBC_01392]|uniref:hypothetical protein n=1 Tax=unclassified Micromonospora TaxID=2617518 RepID=UPI0032504243
MVPKPGDVLYVNRGASVQFGGDRALIFRVIKISGELVHHDWIWLTGYVLDQAGNALARREIFVQKAGLLRADPPRAVVRQPRRKPAAATPAKDGPRQGTRATT